MSKNTVTNSNIDACPLVRIRVQAVEDRNVPDPIAYIEELIKMAIPGLDGRNLSFVYLNMFEVVPYVIGCLGLRGCAEAKKYADEIEVIDQEMDEIIGDSDDPEEAIQNHDNAVEINPEYQRLQDEREVALEKARGACALNDVVDQEPSIFIGR